MTIELTPDELTMLRLVCSLGMEIYQRDIKKIKGDKTNAIAQFERCMQVVYGKVNPNAWCGGELTFKNFSGS